MAGQQTLIRWVIVLGLVACGTALALSSAVVSTCRPRDRDTPVAASGKIEGERLYAVATGLGEEKLPARMEAARKLARLPEAAPWIALLLVSFQETPTEDEAEQRRQAHLRPFDLAVVVAALRALPSEVDAEVLWAATFLLREEQRAQWHGEEGFILKSYTSSISPPVQEVAKNFLKSRVGGDHGWDASAWRAAILQRDT